MRAALHQTRAALHLSLKGRRLSFIVLFAFEARRRAARVEPRAARAPGLIYSSRRAGGLDVGRR
jgi:hypothetical protein